LVHYLCSSYKEIFLVPKQKQCKKETAAQADGMTRQAELMGHTVQHRVAWCIFLVVSKHG
jgi:hypothetical protein